MLSLSLSLSVTDSTNDKKTACFYKNWGGGVVKYNCTRSKCPFSLKYFFWISFTTALPISFFLNPNPYSFSSNISISFVNKINYMHIKYKFLWYISKKKGHGTTNLISWISCTRVLNKLELPFFFIQMSFHNTWSTTLLCGKLTHLPLNFYFVINLLMSFTIAFMSQLLTIYHFAMLKSSITFIVKQTVLIRNLL